MNDGWLIRLLLGLAACGCASDSVAWDICLKSELQSQAALVRLRDVAELSGLPEQALNDVGQVVLAPGPSKSFRRTLSHSQIRKILKHRGVELSGCRFTGARLVVVSMPTTRRHTTTETGPVVPTSFRKAASAQSVRDLEQRSADMIQTQLTQLTGDSRPWVVDVSVDSDARRQLPATWQTLSVEGLKEPSPGAHQLMAHVVTDGGDIDVPLQVEVNRMVQAVFPVKDLVRGATIQAGDVELRYVKPDDVGDTQATQLDQVVGRQSLRTLDSGRPVDRKGLNKPQLVKRHDTIEVYARRGGIVVRRPVRAMQDGAQGDLITVESLDGEKSRFTVRVVAAQVAEAFVSATPVVSRINR